MMFTIKNLALATIFLLSCQFLFAGKPDTTIFALPLEEPVDLSANFGELRANHFHGGLDFRTGGQEGKQVFSIADGYISMIRIDSKGYGLQLFITHPNGYMSSYAHFLRFNDKIAKYIQEYQILHEQNMLFIKIPAGALPVKRCEMIGLSGNTGSSRGPHVHFEITELSTGKIVNPLQFFPSLKDNRKPIINNIGVYPMDDNSTVNGTNKDVVYPASRKSVNQDYGIIQPITVSGSIGFSIQATDYMNNYAHIFGIYKVQLFQDSVLVYEHKMDKVEPWEQRCINSFIDYPYYLRTKNFLQKTFVEPNNKLGFYSKVNENRGVIPYVEEGTHRMMFVVTDYHGNFTKMKFTINVRRPAQMPHREYVGIFFPCNKENVYKTNGFKAVFPKGAVFKDLYFTYSIDSVTKLIRGCSPIYKIVDGNTPIRDSVQISIKVNKSIPEKYLKKLTIAQYLGPNSTSPIGGRYDTGYVTAPVRSFARYVVILDTLPPVVQPLKVYDRVNLSAIAGLFFRIGDNLSGVKNFNLWIDGVWSIMYNDSKKSTIEHWFDPARMEYGKWHTAKLEVTDNRGNTKTLEFTFYK
jgi:hypothetical protein